MPSHYGKKSPAKHTGKGKGNHLDSQTHGKEISFHRHKNLGGGQYKDNWKVVMDKKPATEYAPFKMKHAKSSPMKANFPSAFKQVDDIKNPVAGASPMKRPLVGKQKNLPEHLRKEILAAPPLKQLDDKGQDFEPFYEGGDYSREQLEAMSKKELKSLFPYTHKKIIKDLKKDKKSSQNKLQGKAKKFIPPRTKPAPGKV